jgi:hypothetical protein
MNITAEQLEEWRAFCEWLDGRNHKCAYPADVPGEWKHLVYVGGNVTGQRARDMRWEVQLISYLQGWRLRQNWRERLAELEKSFAGESGTSQPELRDGMDAH